MSAISNTMCSQSEMCNETPLSVYVRLMEHMFIPTELNALKSMLYHNSDTSLNCF